jgi:hypothetical protein
MFTHKSHDRGEFSNRVGHLRRCVQSLHMHIVFWPFDRRIGPHHSVDQDGLNMRGRVFRIDPKAALQLLNNGVG